MQIRMKTSMVGPDVSYQPGDVIEVESRIAAAWIEAGIADPVKGKTESAAMEQPETADVKPARKRKS